MKLIFIFTDSENKPKSSIYAAEILGRLLKSYYLNRRSLYRLHFYWPIVELDFSKTCWGFCNCDRRAILSNENHFLYPHSNGLIAKHQWLKQNAFACDIANVTMAVLNEKLQ